MRRLLPAIVVLLSVLLLWGVLPLASSGAPTASTATVQKKIVAKRGAIARKKGRERVLASTIGRYTRRIDALQADITKLQTRQQRLQADLDAKRAELGRIQRDLRSERARLVRLRARLAEARDILATRLLERYKADEPDAITVVLNSDGFADLLERSAFLERINDQDRRIIARVKGARSEAKGIERKLTRLERRQREITAVVQERRDEVAAVKGRLVDRREGYAAVRAEKDAALDRTRQSRQHLEGDLRSLEAEQARIRAALMAAQQRNAGTFSPTFRGPIRRGSGSLVWPVNGPVVSPFGPRWGRLHAGVDIAVPAGTPIVASDSGTVAIAGWMGGYGNYVCVQHSSTLSTCNGHLSVLGVSVGQHVTKGQTIGAVGCTGHCFGDHTHFEVRVSGTPVNPMGYL